VRITLCAVRVVVFTFKQGLPSTAFLVVLVNNLKSGWSARNDAGILEKLEGGC